MVFLQQTFKSRKSMSLLKKETCKSFMTIAQPGTLTYYSQLLYYYSTWVHELSAHSFFITTKLWYMSLLFTTALQLLNLDQRAYNSFQLYDILAWVNKLTFDCTYTSFIFSYRCFMFITGLQASCSLQLQRCTSFLFVIALKCLAQRVTSIFCGGV